MEHPVHIIGRGIVGLALGFELASRGRSVVLHGPRQCLGAATQAAVGVCSVKGNAHADTPLFADKIAAQRELLAWLERIERASGRTVPKLTGILEPFYDLKGYEAIRERVFHRKFTGCNRSKIIDSSMLPSYAQGAVGAFSYPGDCWYDPIAALDALEEALLRLGARTRDGMVESIQDHPDRGVLLRTAAGPVHAERVVVAAGIFSNGILSRSGVEGLQQAPVEGESVFGSRDPGPPDGVLNFMKTNFVAYGSHVAYGSSSRPKKSLEACAEDCSAPTALRHDIARFVPYAFSFTRWGIRGRFRSQAPLFSPFSTPSQLRRGFFLAGFHKSGLQLAHHVARQVVDKLLIPVD